MFYVKVNRPVYLNGEQQNLYKQANKILGLKDGVYLVRSGYIQAEKGDVRYRDFLPLFEQLPTYRGHWDDKSPINKVDGKDVIMIDLFTENELLLERGVAMVLHEVNKLDADESGKYLLLCSDEGVYFQVIAK